MHRGDRDRKANKHKDDRNRKETKSNKHRRDRDRKESIKQTSMGETKKEREGTKKA